MLAACGGGAPATQLPVTKVAPSGTGAPEPPPLVIEYVAIHRRWVEKVLATPSSDVKTWSEAPENADAASGPVRQVTVKVSGAGRDAEAQAKKKAQALLDRVKKGEDFGKLAKEQGM